MVTTADISIQHIHDQLRAKEMETPYHQVKIVDIQTHYNNDRLCFATTIYYDLLDKEEDAEDKEVVKVGNSC